MPSPPVILIPYVAPFEVKSIWARSWSLNDVSFASRTPFVKDPMWAASFNSWWPFFIFLGINEAFTLFCTFITFSCWLIGPFPVVVVIEVASREIHFYVTMIGNSSTSQYFRTAAYWSGLEIIVIFIAKAVSRTWVIIVVCTIILYITPPVNVASGEIVRYVSVVTIWCPLFGLMIPVTIVL